MNTKPIEELIIQSEENFRIAEAVVSALPGARHRLAVGFLARLDTRLKTNLQGWKSENPQTFFTDRGPCYSIWKPAWAGQYGLSLQFGDYGKKMRFGLYREIDQIGERPFCEELMNAVKDAFPHAVAEGWWEALILMESPAEDWSKMEILWRMHKDDSFLDDVADQLLELERISEPIVDGLVQKYKK